MTSELITFLTNDNKDIMVVTHWCCHKWKLSIVLAGALSTPQFIRETGTHAVHTEVHWGQLFTFWNNWVTGKFLATKTTKDIAKWFNSCYRFFENKQIYYLSRHIHSITSELWRLNFIHCENRPVYMTLLFSKTNSISNGRAKVKNINSCSAGWYFSDKATLPVSKLLGMNF